MKELRSKVQEALLSTLPITAIVYVLSLTPWFNFTVTELITFTVGAVLLVLGLGLFSLGADMAMTPMGAHVGAGLSRQKKLTLLLVVCFVLGMLITIAEPDLQVLAKQVSAVMNGTVLIYAVGIGVGAFLVVAIMKIVFRRSLSSILMLVGSACTWVTDYQEYHGHSEIAAQWDETLAKKWKNLFVCEVLVALATSVVSVFGTVILMAADMLTDTISTVIIILSTVIGLVLEGLYLIYMKRTLALIET